MSDPSTLKAYTKLLKSAQPVIKEEVRPPEIELRNVEPQPDPNDFFNAAKMSRALICELIDHPQGIYSAPFKLYHGTTMRLAKSVGYSHNAWSALAACLVGARLLHPGRDYFEPLITREQLKEITDEELLVRLFDGLTCHLYPPETIAGIAWQLGIPPMMFIQATLCLRSSSGNNIETTQLIEQMGPALHPDGRHDIPPMDATFACLSVLLTVCEQLTPGKSYSSKAMGKLARELFAWQHSRLLAQMDLPITGTWQEKPKAEQNKILDEDAHSFIAHDFLFKPLFALGAARFIDIGLKDKDDVRFVINHKALQCGYRVLGYDKARRDLLFSHFLTKEAGFTP
jgi:hypothetical protein